MGENAPNRLIKFFRAHVRQLARQCQGMYPRREQALVGIDVSQAGQESLIEQQGLDAGLASQAGAELLETDFERFGTQPRHPRGRTLAELDPAELAWVVIQQQAVVERE